MNAATGFWLLYLTLYPLCQAEAPGEHKAIIGMYELYGGPQGCGTAEEVLKAGMFAAHAVECVFYSVPQPDEQGEDDLDASPLELEQEAKL